jgi:hypothetical protein
VTHRGASRAASYVLRMSMSDLGNRLQLVSTFLEDRPNIHDGAPKGVWEAGRRCYEFIAEFLPTESISLETGLGTSTLLFSQWSKRHVCVVGSTDEVDRLRSYAAERDIDLSSVRFSIGSSDVVMPALEVVEPVDFLFVDGGHGFPIPAIDWYYGSLHLREGGILVVDDIQLPSVHDFLVVFLKKDPRWVEIDGDWKWIAFRKVADFSVREEWTAQDFLGSAKLPKKKRSAKASIRRQLSRLRLKR